MISPEVRSILNCLKEPAILLGPDYRILLENDAYAATYGSTQPLGARCCYQVSHHYEVPCDLAGESCPLKQSRETGENAQVLHIHHTPRGEEYVDIEMWPVKDPADRILYFIEILRPSSVASTRGSGRRLIGRSDTFRATMELVERVAASDTTVMLLGESGTGKELVAETLHRLSARAAKAFVPVECAGLPDALFESELFGHAKGAFTGAAHDRTGLVEAAAGGTLFLDELGDIPLSAQVKILRLLESRRFRRVGSTEWRDADFRLVCATHRDLPSMISQGAFREDLYYRLNVFEIDLPPLRERLDDLEPLIESTLDQLSHHKGVRFSAEAMGCLASYDFPGNVRELRNIVERATLLAVDGVVRPEHLPRACRRDLPNLTAPGTDVIEALATVEQRYLRRALARHRGSRKDLAAKLGISERALYRKLSQLQSG